MTCTSLTFAALGATLSIEMRLAPSLASMIIRSLAQKGCTEETIFSAYKELYPKLPSVDEAKYFESKKLIEKSMEIGVEAIPIIDSRYPPSLAAIDDPPPVLYLRGDVNALNFAPGLAVVGTRKATRHGLIVAERIAEHFSRKGWVIVSGLAMGIDAAAHKGALKGNGRTIAVLAHGLDEVYPKTNKNLADQILQNQGAIVSEYPIGFPAKPEQFVLRNRLQIGLSAGSVIVEGEEKSGTKTQAEYCLRNHRHLFAVLPLEGRAKLNLTSLLPKILVEKRGATPIHSRDDYDTVEAMIVDKRAQLMAQQPFHRDSF